MSGSPARVLTIDELEMDRPMALIDRRRIVGAHAMISHVTLHEGFTVEPHAHENEQFAVVLSGRVRFSLGEAGSADDPERVVELVGGQVLHLPPWARHGAEAVETSVILDVFSPPSEKTGVDAG